MRFKLSDLSFVMLSYDEENADSNFADLKIKVPWALRSHGVTGFDAAHLAAADMATTDVFCTVDGDNRIDPAVLDLVVQTVADRFAISLNAINSVNGLIYGNGSIKVWTKTFIRTMKSHENADAGGDRRKIDFCWNEGYHPTYGTPYSTTVINTTPYQAWRAGYREGAKMMVDYREREAVIRSILRRFLIWCSVGADTENGIYAQRGAVRGAFDILDGVVEPECISDYRWMREAFDRQVAQGFCDDEAHRAELASVFKTSLPMLTPEQSQWFKWVNQPTEPRLTFLEV